MLRFILSKISKSPHFNSKINKKLNFTLRPFSNKSKDSALIIRGTKKLKPLINSMRHARLADRRHLFKGGPVWELTAAMRKTGGRNHHGRITVRGRGGGHKRRYRFIDFARDLLDEPGRVLRLEYDPNRSAHIALIKYPTKENLLRYIIAPDGLKVDDEIISSREKLLDLKPGNAMPLKNIPLGAEIHNVEIRPGTGGQIARSAGTSIRVIEKESGPKNRFVTVEMKSKEKRLLLNDCMATVGRVGNVNHNFIILGKAGRKRNLGRRPKVRGMAMNPCDHPHGGGNGRNHGGHLVSKWGTPAKGYRTRKRRCRTNKFRVERRPPNINRVSDYTGIMTEMKWGQLDLEKEELARFRLKPKAKQKPIHDQTDAV